MSNARHARGVFSPVPLSHTLRPRLCTMWRPGRFSFIRPFLLHHPRTTTRHHDLPHEAISRYNMSCRATPSIRCCNTARCTLRACLGFLLMSGEQSLALCPQLQEFREQIAEIEEGPRESAGQCNSVANDRSHRKYKENSLRLCSPSYNRRLRPCC